MTFFPVCVCLLPNCVVFSFFFSSHISILVSRHWQRVHGFLKPFSSWLSAHQVPREPHSTQPAETPEHVWTPGPLSTLAVFCVLVRSPKHASLPGSEVGFCGKETKADQWDYTGLTRSLMWTGRKPVPLLPITIPSPKPFQFVSSTGSTGGVTHGKNICYSPSAGAW